MDLLEIYLYCIYVYTVMPDWIRKLTKLSPEENKILADAVEYGIAANKMGAIHIAIELLSHHVEMKKPADVRLKEGKTHA
jgi:hypothetical protein